MKYHWDTRTNRYIRSAVEQAEQRFDPWNGAEDPVNRQAEATQQQNATVEALTDWWMDTARTEVEKVAPKAVEYGSTDLSEIGRTLSQVIGRGEGDSEAAQAELGIYFYLVGKMARWTDAIKSGRPVSDDTLHDIGVYVRMVQRIRDVGGWPHA